MLGTVALPVAVEIRLAPAKLLMLGAEQAAAGVTSFNNTPSKTEVRRDVIGADIGRRRGVLAAEAEDYALTNSELRLFGCTFSRVAS